MHVGVTDLDNGRGVLIAVELWRLVTDAENVHRHRSLATYITSAVITPQHLSVQLTGVSTIVHCPTIGVQNTGN